MLQRRVWAAVKAVVEVARKRSSSNQISIRHWIRSPWIKSPWTPALHFALDLPDSIPCDKEEKSEHAATAAASAAPSFELRLG
jgi:hypothetical protein